MKIGNIWRWVVSEEEEEERDLGWLPASGVAGRQYNIVTGDLTKAHAIKGSVNVLCLGFVRL